MGFQVTFNYMLRSLKKEGGEEKVALTCAWPGVSLLGI